MRQKQYIKLCSRTFFVLFCFGKQKNRKTHSRTDTHNRRKSTKSSKFTQETHSNKSINKCVLRSVYRHTYLTNISHKSYPFQIVIEFIWNAVCLYVSAYDPHCFACHCLNQLNNLSALFACHAIAMHRIASHCNAIGYKLQQWQKQ